MIRHVFLIPLLFAGCSTNPEDKRQPGSGDGDGDGGVGAEIAEVTLTWDAYEPSDAAFTVYASPFASGNDERTSIAVEQKPTDASAPSLTLRSDQYTSLQRFLDGEACFTVVAVVDGVESEPTKNVCLNL